ncbi:MAG: hypothetical protein K2W96_06940, partial [Gemmataceae bacterium]|nr:hypothetical protein [Gemmataceae bacterium]
MADPKTEYKPKHHCDAPDYKPGTGMVDPLAPDDEKRRQGTAQQMREAAEGRLGEATALCPPWPVLAAEARHGLIGRIVDAIEPETESDPAAVLVQGLVAIGNAVGRSPFVRVEGDKHHANLFAVIVGNSALGRKGTSWSRVRQVMEHAAPEWSADCVKAGLASGEGVVWHVRDGGGEDEGVADKRLMIVESEFAAVLKVMQREGNTLSPLIRQCWDTGKLATLAKNAPTTATDA